MKSRRLIKKLSKALSVFYSDAWICEDREEIIYNDKYLNNISAKGIYHVGGGVDYWGEGQEAYTVLEAAERDFNGWQYFCGCEICQDSFDPASTRECDISKARAKIRPTFKAIKQVLCSA